MEAKIQQSVTGRNFFALVLTVAGAYVWFFNGSDSELSQNLMSGVGVLIFLMGITHLGILKRWSGLSAKERKSKMIMLAIVGSILLLGMIIFF